MTTKQSFFDRLAVFIVGVLLVVVGLVPAGMYFDIPYVTEWLQALPRESIAEALTASWYPWAAGAVAAVLLVIGVSMLVVNLRSRGFSRREWDEGNEAGTTTVHIGRLAGAMGEALCAHEAVTAVDTSVAMERRRPTVTLTVHAQPQASLHEVVGLIEAVEHDFREAVEDTDLDTVYKLHLDRVES